MSRRVLLVLPTGTYRAAAFLGAARRLGLEVVVASEHPSTLGALHPGEELVVDFTRPELAPAALAGLADPDSLAAVVAADETAVLVASHLAASLGLPGNPPEAAAATRDKARLRARLAAGGVPQPEWTVWDGWSPPPWELFPAVLKPLDQAASRGVVRVDAASGLVAAGAHVRRLLAEVPECEPALSGGPRPLLVERFVPGPEVAVEALTAAGALIPLAIYDKPDPLDGPYFEETIYTVPTGLAPEDQQAVLASLTAAVDAIGLATGPVHAELRLGRGLPQVIDLASRSIGGRCSAVLHFQGGSTLEELILLNALGDPLPQPALEPGGAGVMMLPVPKAGRLLEVSGREAALAMPGVESLEISVPIGERIEPPPRGDRYLGFMFARAADGPEAARRLRRAHSQLQFEID
jgi:biotin carboxylase